MMNEIDMIQTEIGQRVTEAQTIADEAQAQAQAEAEAAHVQLIRELENLELDAVNDQELADSMAALSLADDTSYLTTDELNKANASRDFVLDAMANADSDLLLARAKQALLSEDKSLIFLYRRYLPAQWEKDNSRGLGVGQEYVRVMRQLEASIVRAVTPASVAASPLLWPSKMASNAVCWFVFRFTLLDIFRLPYAL